MSTSTLSAPSVSREDSRPQGVTPRKRHPGQAASHASRTSQELHSKIMSSLANSGYAALAFIGCDVDRNRVILRGSVPSYHLKQLAQVFAQRVDGIGRIDNQLKVRRL